MYVVGRNNGFIGSSLLKSQVFKFLMPLCVYNMFPFQDDGIQYTCEFCGFQGHASVKVIGSYAAADLLRKKIRPLLSGRRQREV